jgi:hypothetical protein
VVPCWAPLGCRPAMGVACDDEHSAIVLAEFQAAGDLPFGWGVRLEPGGYRLRRRSDSAAFGPAQGLARGSSSCIRPGRSSGPPAWPTVALRSRPTTQHRPGWRSSACGRVTFGRSVSRTRCSAVGTCPGQRSGPVPTARLLPSVTWGVLRPRRCCRRGVMSDCRIWRCWPRPATIRGRSPERPGRSLGGAGAVGPAVAGPMALLFRGGGERLW